MKVNKIVLLVITILSFSSCKKTYTCQCTNLNGSYNAGDIEGTKRQASKQCQKLSSGGTTCDINNK